MVSNPTPQRQLRTHRPERPVQRVLNSAEHHAWLARHLTDRDRWLCRMLFEHHVLTSTQIIDIAFTGRRAANLRLRNLYQWGVVHRFQPHRDRGSHPMYYVLDTAGAVALAREDGIDPKELGYRREREIGRAFSLQLAHTVGCNGLFTTLVHQARQPGAAGQLMAWWSAARCGRHWGDIVTPDGYGRWREAGRDVEWFIEFDFGTEPTVPPGRQAGPLRTPGRHHRHHHPRADLAAQRRPRIQRPPGIGRSAARTRPACPGTGGDHQRRRRRRPTRHDRAPLATGRRTRRRRAGDTRRFARALA
ncbi:Replication-relaxation [Amycolatopsis saalfeldensis]|uniref:Replication-relaxation n=1 Tax=Amycolatopsis saalfeldensis TaxID=394193 RepID=A0A1H8YRN7_9PSEU|nr:Replication-relaxation [Amycolatopsis saalfeldensis]